MSGYFQKTHQNFNYKEFVGPLEAYEYHGLCQKQLLLKIGLKPNHKFLEVGCGGLRLGRLLIDYLNPNNYIGIEPMKSILDEAIKEELNDKLIKLKKPKFFNYSDFNFYDENDYLFSIQNFIIAFDVFFHCGKSQLELFLKNINNISNKQTKILISVKLNDESLNTGIIESKEGGYYYPHASHRDVFYSIKDFQSIALRFGFESKLLKVKKDIFDFYDKNPPHGSRLIFLLNKL